ncbi:MAG: hypothetical protein KGN00_00805 [Chloroflexota bacterium]|nr:hypothetical protein [Chloroflexota bacterium]MDE3192199.1 hypothetical protein [Chloroflexota bacterium]
MRRRAVYAIWVALGIVAVVLFRAFDASSHSASDTIRPFLITVVPLVIVALLATRSLSRRA